MRSIAPRIKMRKGKRRNARNLFPLPFSGKFLEKLSVPDVFDLASSVNGFSACFSLSLHIYSVPPYFFPRVEFAESSVLQRLFGIDESRSGKRRADLSSYLTHSASNCTPSSCRVRPSFRSFLGSYLLSHQLRSRIWDSGDFSNLSSFSF